MFGLGYSVVVLTSLYCCEWGVEPCLGLDDILCAGELPGDPGRLLLVGGHTELLHRHPVLLHTVNQSVK